MKAIYINCKLRTEVEMDRTSSIKLHYTLCHHKKREKKCCKGKLFLNNLNIRGL